MAIPYRRRPEPVAAALRGRRAAGLRRGPAAGADLGAGAAAAAGARPQRDPRERGLGWLGVLGKDVAVETPRKQRGYINGLKSLEKWGERFLTFM